MQDSSIPRRYYRPLSLTHCTESRLDLLRKRRKNKDEDGQFQSYLWTIVKNVDICDNCKPIETTTGRQHSQFLQCLIVISENMLCFGQFCKVGMRLDFEGEPWRQTITLDWAFPRPHCTYCTALVCTLMHILLHCNCMLYTAHCTITLDWAFPWPHCALIAQHFNAHFTALQLYAIHCTLHNNSWLSFSMAVLCTALHAALYSLHIIALHSFALQLCAMRLTL